MDWFVVEGVIVVVGDFNDFGIVGVGLDVVGYWEWIFLDVIDEVLVMEFVELVYVGYGGVDVLVNNVGIMVNWLVVDEMVVDWDLIMVVNL